PLGAGDAPRAAGGQTPVQSHEILVDRATLRDNGNPCARIPPADRVLLERLIQNFARNPGLVNKRLLAPYYRPQTLASMMAKSQGLLMKKTPHTPQTSVSIKTLDFKGMNQRG